MTSIEAAPVRATNPSAPWPGDMDNYLFDLRGYVILRGALTADQLTSLNVAFDEFPTNLDPWGWWGNVQRSDAEGDTHKGYELQNVAQAGPAFEQLIDHPAWINYMRTWAGETDSYVEGLFIDECFASVRRAGGYFDVHSGGYHGAVRGQYRYVNGVFRCGQVNALMALTDIGPGDGGTMIIPGSHKSNFPHPGKPVGRDRMDEVEGAIEVHLDAGDVLLFCDGIAHGGSSRTTTEGERRVVIYRYGPSWASTRHGYRYSDDLLERVTPQQRDILQPVTPRLPGRG